MSAAKIPDVIYHYTSNDVLLKILEGKALRLGAKHHLNDTTEGELFFTLLATHRSQPDASRMDGIRRALAPLEFFATCFSSSGDRLSQWRGYATNGAGVAIGFKTSAILEAISGSHEALLYPVAYADRLEELPEDRLKTIDAILSSSGTPNQKAIQSFAKERWAIKPAGFSEEQETRLIVTIDTHSGDLQPKTPGFHIGYFTTSTEMREFCDFRFEGFARKDLIESITLGPNNRTDTEALNRLLKLRGYGSISIHKSRLSYR